MGEILDQHELWAKYTGLMGTDLADVYCGLYTELALLHIKWRRFDKLYCRDLARVDLLNSCAPNFFGHLQKTLYEDMVLHVGRMTDSEVTGGEPNLTIRRLPALVREIAALQPDIESLTKAALAKAEFARKWRNKRLAHADLKEYRSRSLVTMMNSIDIPAFLKETARLLNRILCHFGQPDVTYDSDLLDPHGGVDELIAHLERSTTTGQ